jgi:hypothetical protein
MVYYPVAIRQMGGGCGECGECGECGVCGVCGGVGGVGGGVGWAVWGLNEQSRPLLTFDIPQTALVATLDTYDFIY